MKRNRRNWLLVSLMAGLVPVGCGDDAVTPDAGVADTGMRRDLGVNRDAGFGDTGGGPDASPIPDAGGSDAAATDLGPSDLGTPDGGGLDAGGGGGSVSIAAARSVVDGPANVAVAQVYVTYEKPEVGLDPAGFFVQADRLGPALFVVSNATVAVGDELSFRVTEMATQDAQRRAASVADLMITSSGFDVSAFSQDLSEESNVTQNLVDYESELVVVTATIVQAPGNGGTGHRGMDIDTAGLQGDGNFELRIPNELQDELGLQIGCVFTAAHTPLWRFNAKAQVSAWVAEDFAGIQCPPTILQSAAAVSASELILTFSRRLDPASLVDPASQITFDNGLVATDAVVVDDTVLVTTSGQSPGLTYTASVGAGLRDNLGGLVSGTASFDGFLTNAVLRINELAGAINNGCDLVELRVIEGGTVAGYTFRERTDLKFTLPAFIVNRNELIILHFNSGNASCSDPGVTNEIAAVDQAPAATYPLNFDTAYDLYTTTGGLVATNNVFTLVGPGNVIVDVLFAANGTTGSTAGGTETQAAAVAAAGQWEMLGGGVPAGGFVDDDFHAHAVQGLAISNRTLSLQRQNDLDTNTTADWTSTATTSSWGLNNPGQQDL